MACADAAIAALRSGTIDASFRAVTMPAQQLPDGIEAARILDEPVQLLTGPTHEFAAARAVTPAELAGHRIWIPGIVTGTEWAAYYDELAAAFGLTIDAIGLNFGTEPLLDVIADSSAPATLVGEQTRLVWPADYDLRRIAVYDPTPVYPHSLIWRSGNPHPALTTLRKYLGSIQPNHRDAAQCRRHSRTSSLGTRVRPHASLRVGQRVSSTVNGLGHTWRPVAGPRTCRDGTRPAAVLPARTALAVSA